MYEFKTRTRYSEYDENSRMRLISLLNYLQNTSSYHSFDSGLSVDYYRSIHKAWLINYWDIHIEALPDEEAYITMGTSPHDIRGLFAYRNFWLKSTETDAYYLKADSVWFLVDTDSLRPVKPTDADVSPFGTSENVLGLKTNTRKVRFDTADGFTHIADIPVARHILDTNHHVNNVHYISAAFDAMTDFGFIDAAAYPSRIRVEYKHAATLGDTLILSAKHVPAADVKDNKDDNAINNANVINDDNVSIDNIINNDTNDINVINTADSAEKIWAAVRGTDGTEYCNIEFTL